MSHDRPTSKSPTISDCETDFETELPEVFQRPICTISVWKSVPCAMLVAQGVTVEVYRGVLTAVPSKASVFSVDLDEPRFCLVLLVLLAQILSKQQLR